MQKEIVILRSVSGSGKSTLAEIMCRGREDATTCCVDDYFMVNGEYKFDASKLAEAHEFCRQNFMKALYDPKINLIIIANTNCNVRDFEFYELRAKELDIRVHHVVIENRHGSKDRHGVPDEILRRQFNNLSNSIHL